MASISNVISVVATFVLAVFVRIVMLDMVFIVIVALIVYRPTVLCVDV